MSDERDRDTIRHVLVAIAKRVRGNLLRLIGAVAIALAAALAMVRARPGQIEARPLAMAGLLVVALLAAWFAARLYRENRTLLAEARELMERFGIEL